MQRKTSVLIVGGGITGLSLASYLRDTDHLIIEKECIVGGYCKTTLRNGFVWDHSGHFFHFTHDDIKDYVLANIDCEVMTVTKISNINYNGHIVDFPFQHNIHQLPVNEFVECLADLYRCGETRPDHSTFKRHVRSMLGDAICDKFIVPYNEKVYACDLDELEYDSMGRFFPSSIGFGELLNQLRNGKPKASYNDTFLYPVRGSFEFVKSIAKRLRPESILTGTELLHVDLETRTAVTTAGNIQFEALVCTMPFGRTLEVVDSVAGAAQRSRLSANKVAVFNLGFDRGSDNQAHWIYFPGDEIFYRVGFYNNILSQDRMSLYIEIGMKASDPVDESVLLRRVMDDLQRRAIVTDQRLIDHQFIVMDPAYVHITDTSRKLYKEWCDVYNAQGIYSIGRYGAWTYCSIEDNIVQAKTLAESINRRRLQLA